MDSITQGLLGAVTGQLGFRQRIGRDATWVAGVAGIVPDLDVFVTPFLLLSGAEVNGLNSMNIHRGLSHSLLIAPLLSLPIALIWWYLRKRNRLRGGRILYKAPTAPPDRPPETAKTADRSTPIWLLYACVLLAIFTHSLLDWCTSYGTQLLSPLTDTRYAADCVGIVDVIYTPLLILTLGGCYLTRKIRPARSVRTTLIIGWGGMLLSVGYLATGRVLHNWALAKATTAAGNKRILRKDAYPALGTIFLWRTVVETEDEWIVMRAHRFSDRPVGTWRRRSVPKTDNLWIRKGRRLPEGRTYNWFARGRVRAKYSLENAHHVVEFHDMRYGWPLESPESLWPLTVIFDGDGRVRHIGRERHPRPPDRGAFAYRAWADIWNP